MRIVVVAFIAVLLAYSSPLLPDEFPELASSAVVLRYPGNVPLGHDDSRALFGKSLEILRSSNFNSSRPLWEWDAAKTNSEYGRAVSGSHVLITFSKPEKMKTAGGYVTARELVIGLNGPQYASSVHTIDGDGKIVGHAKYKGDLCIEILELVKQLASRPPSSAEEPTRSTSQPLDGANEIRV